MIEGINITKKFDDNILFDKFNFIINEGDFVCFSGNSGSGKTTLLNMIGMIEPIDSGQLLIDGKEIQTNKHRLNYFRSVVGYLFQNFALVDNKTVEENLCLVRKSNRTNYSIEEALEKVGLKDKLKSKVYTLSGGEQQRVALARLFLKKCKIVLADEPTGSLDAKNAEIVMNIIKDMNKEGKTIVLVTHDEKIKNMTDRIIQL
ncbi:putative ABC transport system ATP-binding protein [Lachnotalea glycerini]|uniref:ATP-binding cassette domain-containing protein n=1 Tax=Lachnotalea glycerini TaxID=1763509 RepID=A0A255IJG4_9FIRM|nr:ATP-binding cassette domain-containing protein [Lachnotalea glycerini]PXV95387.1 putative ABC transport system ATP-binding protein [Lachnotalea glycerini]RDY32710.1 ATP-binding cassette domain-containing protein [Lachnotalea glycerini]